MAQLLVYFYRINSIQIMYRNYIKTAVHNLLENKIFTGITISGLSVGISAFILLYLYVFNEVTYDNFHKNKKSIYRVCENDMEFTRSLLLQELLSNYPEVVNGCRVLDWFEHTVSYNSRSFRENILYVDTGFLHVFSFPVVAGNPSTALEEKNSVVITRKVAKKLFGDRNPVGEVLEIDFAKHQLTVSAVIGDIPSNSSIKFDFLVNYEKGTELSPWISQLNNWRDIFSQTYIQLEEGFNPGELKTKLPLLVKKNFFTGNGTYPELNLLLLNELHDKSTDNESFIYILICIAAGILLIASINFINLSIARSITRIREIGVRKVLGAGKKQLVMQMLGESLIVSIVALFAGIVITEFTLPVFNRLFETSLVLNYTQSFYTIALFLALWLITGFISGVIPAFILSGLKTIPSLKGQNKKGRKGNFLQSSLVIFQFVVSFVLIIGTITISKQIGFMRNHELNFDKENVVVINTNMWQYKNKEAASRKINMIVNQLRNDNRVVSATASQIVPGRYIHNYSNFFPEEWSEIQSVNMRHADVGADYFKTYGIRFIDGRSFDEKLASDSNAVIINQTAFKELKAEGSITGKTLHRTSATGKPFTVIGVVEDFYYEGLHKKIEPVLHYCVKVTGYNYFDYVSIRAKPRELTNVVQLLEKKWSSIEPAQKADYFFADDEIDKQYQQFVRINAVTAYFTTLAIIIACLGLLALTSFITGRRTKEIGIRKIIGSSVKGIIFILMKQMVFTVIIASALAFPLAYYTTRQWLMGFACKTQISWWIFVVSGIGVLAVFLLTMSWQSTKAALRNPAECLRYE